MTRKDNWQQRWHPLLQEWIIVAAHRQHRPWLGESHDESTMELPAFDADCYLCPRNSRVGGVRNPDYSSVYVFDNDHPCVSLDAPDTQMQVTEPYRSLPARGISRVVCFTPRHDLTLAELSIRETEELVAVWQREYTDLAQVAGLKSIMMFENKGEVCGTSNPHAHGQIYATNFPYKHNQSHLQAASSHFEQTGRVLYQDILGAEQDDGSRIVHETQTCIAFIPWFSRYAYEVHIAPRRSCANIAELTPNECVDLAQTLNAVLIRYDNLWNQPFPYLMMLHQAPLHEAKSKLFHFHIQLYPPLRKPGVMKYLAAIEVGGGNFVADTLPDEKAAELRAASALHYKST